MFLPLTCAQVKDFVSRHATQECIEKLYPSVSAAATKETANRRKAKAVSKEADASDLSETSLVGLDSDQEEEEEEKSN